MIIIIYVEIIYTYENTNILFERGIPLHYLEVFKLFFRLRTTSKL